MIWAMRVELFFTALKPGYAPLGAPLDCDAKQNILAANCPLGLPPVVRARVVGPISSVATASLQEFRGLGVTVVEEGDA